VTVDRALILLVCLAGIIAAIVYVGTVANWWG
jgi:hypothetical protein